MAKTKYFTEKKFVEKLIFWGSEFFEIFISWDLLLLKRKVFVEIKITIKLNQN